jgi:hypothetical protein
MEGLVSPKLWASLTYLCWDIGTVKDFWEYNYSYDIVHTCLQELQKEQMTFA